MCRKPLFHKPNLIQFGLTQYILNFHKLSSQKINKTSIGIPMIFCSGILKQNFESGDDRKTSSFESMTFISSTFSWSNYIRNDYHGRYILSLYRLSNRHSARAFHIKFVNFELSHDLPKDLRLLHLRLMRHQIAIKKLFKNMHLIKMNYVDELIPFNLFNLER